MARATKKITANLPDDILDQAMRITGKGITETLIDGLRELTKREQRSALRRLRGKLPFDLNLNRTRA